MDENKKYFGMTVTQIGILAGLAGAAMILFCMVGVLIVRNGFGNAAPAQEQSPTLTPTFQPTATITLTPTQTPLPTFTPVPYESLIPASWAQHKTVLSELWLPAGYKTAKQDILIVGLTDTPMIDLTVRGALNSKSPNKIYVTVSYEPLPGGTLDEFVSQRLTQLGSSFLADRSKATLNTVPAIRLIFSGRKGSADINELTYIILDGGTIWYVQYTAVINEFFDLLPMFESSAKTFRLAR